MQKSPLLSFFFLTAGIALAVGCSDPAANKAKADVKEVKTDATKVATPKGKPVAFTEENGTVVFVASKASGSEEQGRFEKFKGNFYVEGDVVTGAQVTIDMNSVTTALPKLTKHLKNGDFFDVPKFPTSTFTTTSIQKKAGDKGETHVVTGALTLRGVTKELTFPATLSKSEKGHSLVAEFAFDRQPFGVAYKGRPDNLINDNVVMKLKIDAK